MCSYSHSIAFWAMANCSWLGINQEFFYANGKRTISLDLPPSTAHILFSSCSPSGESKSLFPPTQAVSEGSSKRTIDVHKNLKLLRCKAQCPQSGKDTHTPHGARGFYQKEGKAPIKASGKFHAYGLAEFGLINICTVGFVV